MSEYTYRSDHGRVYQPVRWLGSFAGPQSSFAPPSNNTTIHHLLRRQVQETMKLDLALNANPQKGAAMIQ